MNTVTIPTALFEDAEFKAAIATADAKLNAKLGYASNPLLKHIEDLKKNGRTEVGYRQCCGSTHVTQLIAREWAKLLKKMQRAGLRISTEDVKHKNAWATKGGGFWHSEIFTIAA